LKKPLLFVSQQFPHPLTDGGNIRTFQLLAALSQAWEITLIASLKPGADKQAALAALSPYCHKVLTVADVKKPGKLFLMRRFIRALVYRQPLALAFNHNRHIAAAVRGEVRENKGYAVYWNHLDTVPYRQHTRGQAQFLDTHNLLFDFYAKAGASASSWPRKALYRLEAARMRRYETRAFAGMRKVLVCSHRERELLRPFGLGRNIAVIPNGVDIDYFHPAKEGYARNPPHVIFTGAMGYGANADGALFFIRSILPLLRDKLPGVKFWVVGKNPPPELIQAGQDWEDVEVTGAVADVRPYVWQARLFVIPLRLGGGTRLKVAEAFAFGIPTVSTTLGAEGFDAEPGKHIDLADDPADFAAAILRLCRETETGVAMGKAARHLAEAALSWRSIGAELAAALAENPA